MQINKFNFLLGKKIIEIDNLRTQIDLQDNEGVSLKFDDNSKVEQIIMDKYSKAKYDINLEF